MSDPVTPPAPVVTPPAPTPPTPPVDPPVVTPSTPPAPPVDPPVDPPDLGEAGKRAIAAERKARADAEKIARDAQAELAKLRASQMSDQEKAIEAAKAEGRGAVLDTVLREKLLRHATGKFADPTDAVALIDRTPLAADADGKFDEDAIGKAISDLLASKPHLAVATGGAKPPPGSANGGPQGQPATQWTLDDVEKATPEQVEAARKAGLLNTLFGIT